MCAVHSTVLYTEKCGKGRIYYASFDTNPKFLQDETLPDQSFLPFPAHYLLLKSPYIPRWSNMHLDHQCTCTTLHTLDAQHTPAYACTHTHTLTPNSVSPLGCADACIESPRQSWKNERGDYSNFCLSFAKKTFLRQA